MAFNKSQKQAIQIKKGPVLVLAGPGSGKTTVITEHAKFLLENEITSDENMLIVTFTNNSANEMKERFNILVDNKYPNVTFGTFHSVYFMIAKEKYSFNESNLIQTMDRTLLIKNIVKKLGVESKDEKDFLSKVSNEISTVKCNLLDINTYETTIIQPEIFRNIYHEYILALENDNNIDFDDMLVLCYKALNEDKDLLKKWQEKFKYILVDEFQDTNTIQFDVLKMLALPENNIFVVGDDDQSIYKFRGARPEIMLNMKNYYPKLKIVNLDINYRSTPQIVDGAQIVIKNNKTRYNKKIEAKNKTGEPIYIETKTNAFFECEDVIEKIKENIALGVSPEDVAIIYRSNLQTRVLTERLMKHEMEFFIRDGVANVYEHWVAKDIFAYIQLAMGKPESIHLTKIINKPTRYVGKDCLKAISSCTIDNIIEYYENSPKDTEWLIENHLSALKGHLGHIKTLTKPSDLVEYICNDIGYVDWLKADCNKNNANDVLEDALFVIEDLKNAAKDFETCEDWLVYIYEYTNELNDVKRNRNKHPNAINLLTMHASKGLEYKVVFIIDANETITPHIKAVDIEDIEEERRMFYVAMTRAKLRLYIYSIRERNGKDIEKSRFVKELQSGLKKKQMKEFDENILKEMQRAQKTIDKMTIEEKEKEIQSLIVEDAPTKLLNVPTIENIDIKKQVYHKTFETGFIQKEDDKKYHIFFIKKNKVIVLDKEFCNNYKLLTYFE